MVMEGYMTIADHVADSFSAGLDMTHLTDMQVLILHAIKSVAVKRWAIEMLRRERGISL